MAILSSLRNLDLLSVGISIAGILVIGFTTYFSNRKSITNRTFALFSIIAASWGLLNYLNYQSDNQILVLWTFRFIMFFATWYTFMLFRLSYVFPSETAKFSSNYKFIILPITIITSVVTLTKYVFPSIAELLPVGQVSKTVVNGGIYLFAGVVVFLVIGSIYMLIKKTKKRVGTEKTQIKFLLFGITLTFFLHIVFNLILPGIFLYVRFIPLGAVFTFPLIIFTAYAILKHHLLNVKVITTEILTFVLAVVTLFEVVISKDPGTLIFRISIFALVLYFGILLIKSVIKEVEQREELQKLTEQLQKTNTKLDSLSRFKSQMLSLAAHQIKAPLATIKGFSTILIDGLYGPISDKIKDTLKKIRFSADDLINLINTLLDLRHVEEGKMDYNFQAVKIKDVATEAFEVIKFPAQQKGIQFTLDCSTEASVNADPQKLKQVLQNLIDNAVKYTPEGFVKVELKEDPSTSSGQGSGSVIFSVTDSGLGIPADLLPHLFDEEFVRDERVKKEILGTGLGLYIAKKIINDHRGEIGVKSDGPGKGSCFFVKLKKI